VLEELKKELISILRIQEGFVESFGFNLKGGLDLNIQRGHTESDTTEET